MEERVFSAIHTMQDVEVCCTDENTRWVDIFDGKVLERRGDEYFAKHVGEFKEEERCMAEFMSFPEFWTCLKSEWKPMADREPIECDKNICPCTVNMQEAKANIERQAREALDQLLVDLEVDKGEDPVVKAFMDFLREVHNG